MFVRKISMLTAIVAALLPALARGQGRHGFEDDAERRVIGQRKLNPELKRSETTNARLC